MKITTINMLNLICYNLRLIVGNITKDGRYIPCQNAAFEEKERAQFGPACE